MLEINLLPDTYRKERSVYTQLSERYHSWKVSRRYGKRKEDIPVHIQEERDREVLRRKLEHSYKRPLTIKHRIDLNLLPEKGNLARSLYTVLCYALRLFAPPYWKRAEPEPLPPSPEELVLTRLERSIGQLEKRIQDQTQALTSFRSDMVRRYEHLEGRVDQALSERNVLFPSALAEYRDAVIYRVAHTHTHSTGVHKGKPHWDLVLPEIKKRFPDFARSMNDKKLKAYCLNLLHESFSGEST